MIRPVNIETSRQSSAHRYGIIRMYAKNKRFKVYRIPSLMYLSVAGMFYLLAEGSICIRRSFLVKLTLTYLHTTSFIYVGMFEILKIFFFILHQMDVPNLK